MEKLVSIVIPVYNAEKSVEGTLNSVLNHSYKNIEVIVVDDGSKDDSLEILKKISENDSRVKVFAQENSGVSAARNFGLDNVKGDFVAFVDDDDILDEGIIEKLVLKMSEIDTDVIRYNFYYSTVENVMEKKGDDYEFFGKIFDGNDIRNKIVPSILKNEICSFMWLLFVKADVLKNIRFDTNTNYMEDTLFYIDMLYSIDSLYFMDEIGYYYYCTTQSKQDNLEFLLKYIRSLNYVYSKLVDKVIENNDGDRVDLLNLKWINTMVDYITMILRVNSKMKFDEWKNLILEMNYSKDINLDSIDVSKYNKISINLLKKDKLKLLFNFTKFRNWLKKCLS